MARTTITVGTDAEVGAERLPMGMVYDVLQVLRAYGLDPEPVKLLMALGKLVPESDEVAEARARAHATWIADNLDGLSSATESDR